MSNFQCPHCGMINVDCGEHGYKTPREIDLEVALTKIRHILYKTSDDTRTKIANIYDVIDAWWDKRCIK